MSQIDEVLQSITNDPKFVNEVKELVDDILEDGKIDMSDIPDMITLVVECYNNFSKFHVKYEQLPRLFTKLTQHIANEMNLIPDNQKKTYNKHIKTAINLVMLQPKVKKCCNKTFSFLKCRK